MVLVGVLIESRDIPKLKNIGVKDSKLLSPKKREIIFKDILKIIRKYKIVIVNPVEIDQALNSDNLNLNRLEAIKSAIIINYLNPDKVVLDCPSNNIRYYTNYLKLFIKNKNVEIDAGHDYDKKFLAVGAASILAKVTRDAQIKRIQFKIKENFGSGYPSDPYTKKFLKENFDKYPEIFRKTWSTYRKIANQKKLEEF